MAEVQSPDFIRNWVQERVNQIDELVEDSETVTVGEVQWHAPDQNGVNWDIPHLQGNAVRNYLRSILRIIEEAQERFRLP